jgi:uncharacterized membrane protein
VTQARDEGAEAHEGDEMSTEAPAQPTPEQIAERARRADRATRAGLAGILGLEAVIVLLIPRTIALTTGLGTARTVVLVVVAVLLVAAAAVQRRPWGIAVGSAMQLLFIATGIFIGTMFLIGVIFLVIWLRLLQLRVEIVGSPSGWRMLGG